jgi:hypothetical protein
MIFDRTAWYFLACRFSSEAMERGCNQVEETFETVDEVADEAGNTLPGCTRKRIKASVTARKNGDHWTGLCSWCPSRTGATRGTSIFG